MMSFRGGRLGRLTLPVSSLWLSSDIAEAKGRQQLYSRQSPQLLKALSATARVQSVESSNRIEGISVSPDRLQPLVEGRARPRDRSEEEIQNYRRALDRIHAQAATLAVTPELLLELHRTLQEGSGDSGEWKKVDNDIVELREGAAPRVRFLPLSVAETPAAVAELCLSYRYVLDQQEAPSLVAVAALVFDFLCIHPFRDGNGRISRLLTLLVLYHHGYEVGRYVSLERLVEESREEYYEALLHSSEGWHEGRHDLVPWLNYFLVMIKRAYREFEGRVGQVKSAPGSKTELVEAAVESFTESFSLTDVEKASPGVSRDMVRRVLRRLKTEGRVECRGRGPGATWHRTAGESAGVGKEGTREGNPPGKRVIKRVMPPKKG